MSSRRQPPNRGPPSRAQPSPTPKSSKKKPSGNADVVKRLQDLIQQKNSTIEQLTERINGLAMKNKTLESKLERLQKSAAASKKKPAGSVDTGPSQKAAGAALGALLGGHVKNKKKAEDKINKNKKSG
eukprot:248102_1